MRVFSVYYNIANFVGWHALFAFCLPAIAFDETADTATSAISANQIALELSNPATALRRLAMDFEYRTFRGDLPEADEQSATKFEFDLSWPLRLANGKNILLSAAVPVFGDQPLWRGLSEFQIHQFPDSEFENGKFNVGHSHMGDIGFNVGYGGSSTNGLTGLIGLAVVLPTNQDRSSARDQYLLGPEFALGKITRWGLIGAQASHLTRVAGEPEERWDTNLSSVDLFFAYGLGNAWQIESNPTIEYDWEAVSGNQWSVPIGAGISKTIISGAVPMKFAVEIDYFVVTPDRFGSDWMITFSFTPVISTKLLK